MISHQRETIGAPLNFQRRGLIILIRHDVSFRRLPLRHDPCRPSGILEAIEIWFVGAVELLRSCEIATLVKSDGAL
jgi:hypothetical protein